MKIFVKDKKGEIVKEYSSAEEAALNEGVSISTILRSCKGQTKSRHNGMNYSCSRGKSKTYKGNEVVLLDKNGVLVRTFNSQIEAANSIGVSAGTIVNYLKGRCKYSKGKFMYKEDYEKLFEKIEKKEEEKPIVKKKDTTCYVNMLVGLANDTLVDGATYEVGAQKFTYNKEKHALLIDNKYIAYSRDSMFEQVNVELPLLLEKERAFLKNLLLAFTNIKGIRKCKDFTNGFEFLRIEAENPVDNIDFPKFKEGKYYANLITDRLYTIEELGL